MHLTPQDKREGRKTRQLDDDDIRCAEAIAVELTKFRHAYVSRAQPHWRWDLDERFDESNQVIEAVWQRFGIMTAGSELLASLLLPYARTQGYGTDLYHARTVKQWSVDLPFIHDRWIRAVANFQVQRVPLNQMPRVTQKDLDRKASLLEPPWGSPEVAVPNPFPPIGGSPPPKAKTNCVSRWTKGASQHHKPDVRTQSPPTTTRAPLPPQPKHAVPKAPPQHLTDARIAQEAKMLLDPPGLNTRGPPPPSTAEPAPQETAGKEPQQRAADPAPAS